MHLGWRSSFDRRSSVIVRVTESDGQPVEAPNISIPQEQARRNVVPSSQVATSAVGLVYQVRGVDRTARTIPKDGVIS